MKVRFCTDIGEVGGLSSSEREQLREVSDTFAFRSNDYYLSLIDWDDPNDPIRRVIIPNLEELERWGRLDPSNEKRYTVMQGVEHKYSPTALFIVNDVCGGICRYCFRKRLFLRDEPEALRDVPAAIDYVRENRQITNILLTGGDPLMSSTRRLADIIDQLVTIDHVHIIRIGSKLPAFNPYRIIDDPELLQLIHRTSHSGKKMYVMTHFNHPHEITEVAREAVGLLSKAGAILCNQTPIIRGVNDDPYVLRNLFKRLSFMGVPPYYVFQCRPSRGNRTFAVPVERAYEIFEQAKKGIAGVAKRARYVMSHATGKIEVVGKTRDRVFFKYHLAARNEDNGRFLSFRSNPEAYWFDDYKEPIRDYQVVQPYQAYGPE